MTEKKTDKRHDFGRHCEFMARTYLEQQGYLILETNWRSGHKEVDIIAKDGEMLVIVEVKARKNEDITNAEDAVDEKKIRNLIRATHNYILLKGLDCDVRFDIITLVLDDKGEYKLKHIKDAFLPGVNV
jgi:putative endonuclease